MPHTTTDNPGLGTKIQIKISGTYTDIPETSSIEWGDFSVGIRNPNTLASQTVKKRPTITNLGKVSFSIWHDQNDSTHAALQGKVAAPPATPDDFKIIFLDEFTTHANIIFKGFVTAYPISGIEVEGTIESKVEIEVTDLYTAAIGVTP